MQINEVYFAGFVGRDSETRTTQNGKSIAGFSLCHTRKAKEGTNGKDESTWIQVTAISEWTIRDCEQVKKGDNVLVKGALQIREYKDKTGKDRTMVSVLANSVARIVKAPAREQAPHPADMGLGEGLEEDIPF